MKRPSVDDLLGLDPSPAPRDAIAEAREALGDAFGGDTINGHAFAEAHAGRLIYVPEWKQWREFADHCWRPCDAGGLMQEWAAARAQKAIDAEARKGTHEAAAMTRVATKLFQDRRQQAAALASAAELRMLRVSSSDLDADPMLLGVKNGVVDLHTGELRKGRPDDRITRQAGAEFNPDAEAPLFSEFLRTVQPDAELRAFLRRALGYTLFGLMDEECLFFIYGGGGTGKSTFANVAESVLGDYSVTCSKSLLVKTHHSTESDRQTYALRGGRLASVNETSAGDVFDDYKVKQHASRERLYTRKLHAEAFSYMPTHTVWLRGNFMPGVQDAGDGFWRRMIPVEFGVQIPKGERIADLDRRIIDSELAGVLAWAVRGALEWRERGLAVPPAIRKARDDYRESTDIFGRWLADCTDRGPGHRAEPGDLFESYSVYMQASGGSPGFIRAFGAELNRRGFDSFRSNGRRYHRGLAVRKRDTSGRFNHAD